MSQQKIQTHGVVEQLLNAWWQWMSPIHSVLQSPIFTALLEDVQEPYQKTLTYWAERPEKLQEKMSDRAGDFKEAFGSLDIEDCENLELLENIQAAQKAIAESLVMLISETDVLNDHEIALLQFTLRQVMAFFNPRNSILSNPEVLQTAIETEGQSLILGVQQYQQDIEESTFGLQVQRSGTAPNLIGKIVAKTAGSVIFENELMQLIHYEAFGDKQNTVPLLLIPPCINKFYILDLMPENSFVRWMCEQGHDVYMVSWINPGQELKDTSFDDYIRSGCLQAIDVVSDFANVERINLLGYCIGGLMASIAAETEQGKNKIMSLTLLTTLLDYSSPGELGLFTSPRILESLKKEIESEGVLKSEPMSLVFTLLREEQLLWRYVRKNYFLGESLPFDAHMHWGQDGTNLPGKMALDYLGDFYGKNCLSSDKYYQFNTETVALSESQHPKYILACEKDHIAPAEAVIDGSVLLGGNIRRVTTTGGHVLGVINPPSEKRGKYKVNDSNSSYIKGSWWNDWQQWIEAYTGDKVQARPCETDDFRAIEAAPGKFVRQ